ncbi:VCBS repeat-containing protein [Methylobacterium sp. Leaf466]|uniref:FG-GAP repeat domain-containing protein n=1 Tax=Methylobacterium sp. Leaf466 TaxID=1736386 RepID=UPI0006F5F238|nr:VCBS repeat-containing protein [Methylobacterium sp. Leaf466]KQT80671.1 hypothetical protein ASG59_04370 [Methylobacterium sp. Leaf466]
MLAADANGDGTPDLIVANGSSGDISVLIGNGVGGFRSAVAYGSGIGALAVAAADLNGDGKLDLAVSDLFGTINVLIGNGAGAFGGPIRSRAGTSPLVARSAVDANGDGRPDLVATGADGKVVTLLNASAAPGTFGAGTIAAHPGGQTSRLLPSTPTGPLQEEAYCGRPIGNRRAIRTASSSGMNGLTR